MVDPHRVLVERLYDAFNRRDVPAMVELCDERMEFHPVTAEEVGRDAPYIGPLGIDEYLRDIAAVWDELLVLPKRIESDGDRMLVRGRVYLRSHQLGIRDIPAAWIWEVRAGRFIRGEVFVDPEQAASRFEAEAHG
jgi:ketosteroid isomerase-like protein